MANNIKVFVYGTLKREHTNNWILNDADFVKETKTLKRYQLWNCRGAFPCMTKPIKFRSALSGMFQSGGGYQVRGELWNVNSQTLHRLDLLENVRSELYAREKIHLASGEQAFAYFFQGDLSGLALIGDSWERKVPSILPPD